MYIVQSKSYPLLSALSRQNEFRRDDYVRALGEVQRDGQMLTLTEKNLSQVEFRGYQKLLEWLEFERIEAHARAVWGPKK